MGVHLEPEEAWDYVASCHTGIHITLRKDGMPIALPVWFVVDRSADAATPAIYLRAPSKTKKIGRIRRDARSSFLVEEGAAWRDLKAVHFTGSSSIVSDEAEAERIIAALDEKYTGFALPGAGLPKATQKHYTGFTVIRFDPDATISWQNSKIRLGS